MRKVIGGRTPVDSIGRVPGAPGGGLTLKTEDIALSSTGTIVAAVTAKKIKVYAIKLIVDAALTVYLRSGASTALEGGQALAANGGYTESVTPPGFLLSTAAGESLDLVISGTGNARGRVSYWDDDDT